MLSTVKSYTKECNGEARTINVIYTEKNIQNSSYYILEKSSYTPCENCNFSDCPIYKSAPKIVQLIR